MRELDQRRSQIGEGARSEEELNQRRSQTREGARSEKELNRRRSFLLLPLLLLPVYHRADPSVYTSNQHLGSTLV